MFLRAITLFACILILGCDTNRDHVSESGVYVSALQELAPAVSHFTIAAEKVVFGIGDLAPNAEQIGEFGSFSFPDSDSLFTEDDFPGLGVTLLYDTDFDDLNAGDCESFWKNFRSKYGQSTGYFRFSSVGFDDNGTKAIFYLAGHGGCLAGQGAIVIMILDDDRWVVVEKKELWVS